MDNANLYNSPDVANRIKEYAKNKKRSLKSLLEACELGSNTISHMLHGRSIAFDSLARIADYLDCSVDYLLGRTDDPHEQLTSEQRTLLSLIEQLSDAEISALLALAKSLLAQHENDQSEK